MTDLRQGIASASLPVLPTRPGVAAIGNQLRLGALRKPRQIAVEVVGQGMRSYAELDERTNRLAQALLGFGLEKGDRVGIWMGNCLEYIEMYLACAKAGLVVVQINIMHKADEAQYQLMDADCSALLYDDSVAEYLDQLDGGLDIRLLIAVGDVRVKHAGGFEELLAAGVNTMPPLPKDGDLLVIGYTSGTTGFPKGAELTHRSVKSLGQTNAIASRYACSSRQVFGLSLSFSAAIPAHVLPHLLVGGTTTILRKWDTDRILGEIERSRATFTILPTPSISEFCELVERNPRRAASLESILHSSSKAAPSHLERLVEAVGPRLVEGWGMTENSGGLLAATVSRDYLDGNREIFNSTGRAVPDCVVTLVDEARRPLPHDGDTVGQLVAHSASLARGYWRNPGATREVFKSGWYFTGDLGRIDPEGYIYVLDRRNDLILSGGMNVYPSEVERVIMSMPGVDECGVVGVPHPRWGTTPVAFIVSRNAQVAPDVAVEFCRKRLANYKVPSQIFVVPQIPKNSSGKILRQELRSLALPGELPEVLQ